MIEIVLEILQCFPRIQVVPFDFFWLVLALKSSKPWGWSGLLLRWSTLSRWWQLKHFLFFTPDIWGKDPIWRAHFSNGLVQPPIKKSWGSSDPKLLSSLPIRWWSWWSDFHLCCCWHPELRHQVSRSRFPTWGTGRKKPATPKATRMPWRKTTV